MSVPTQEIRLSAYVMSPNFGLETGEDKKSLRIIGPSRKLNSFLVFRYETGLIYSASIVVRL
jgi:hypothetical protein